MFTYFIGIGSNISPTRHIPAAVDLLLKTSKNLAIRLGRDRNDPDRKVKNSTIDLDILLHLENCQSIILQSSLPAEP